MSRAWFALVLVAVLGLFYVGYGLHSGSPGLAVGSVAYGQEASKPKHLEWQVFLGESGVTYDRAKVSGGWILRIHMHGTSRSDGQMSLAFMPDPEHKWDGNSLP